MKHTRLAPTFLCLPLLALALTAPTTSEDPTKAIEAVLTDFHDAAATGDAERYFAHLAPDLVYFGTDASERWPFEEYEPLVRGAFEAGATWKSVPVEQHVFVSARGDIAWFDERLERAKYGELRATGVLRLTDEGWKIVQFHLTLPVPNEAIKDVVKLIRATKK